MERARLELLYCEVGVWEIKKEQDLKLDPNNLRYALKKDYSSTCGLSG